MRSWDAAQAYAIIFKVKHGAEHIKQQPIVIGHAVHKIGPAQAGKARALAAAFYVVVPDLLTL